MNSDLPTILAAEKCFICFGVSHDEALELALLSVIANPNVPPTTPAIQLSFQTLFNPDGGVWESKVNWIWTGADPVAWLLQNSPDNSNWSMFGTLIDGSIRGPSFVVNQNFFYRMWQSDLSDDLIGEPSNVEFIPIFP